MIVMNNIYLLYFFSYCTCANLCIFNIFKMLIGITLYEGPCITFSRSLNQRKYINDIKNKKQKFQMYT